jgi:hypothetical protein
MPGGYTKPHVTNATANVSTSTVKTVEASTAIKSDIQKREVVFSGKQNVLNRYRTYTYKWTLAALKKGYDRNPSLYRDSTLDLIIIQSGGKGTGGITVPGDLESKKAEVNKKYQQESTSMSATADSLKNAKKELDASLDRLNSTSGLVTAFNKESPGRFDMFIDQVEIYSLLGFGDNNQTVTQPNTIKFEIIEPYSVNGFIEALQVAGVAAGYSSYLESNYVLKLEFVGYPDNDSTEFKPPEIIPDSTRYFPFRFLGVEMEITDRGTKYRCAASPINEKTFGEPDKLKKPISASGNTVGTILKDLFANLNTQVRQHDANSKTPQSSNNNYNEYEIKFPTWDSKIGWNFEEENAIAKAEIVQILKEPAVYKFPDPAKEENKNKNNYNPRRGNAPVKDTKAVEAKTKEPESVKLTPGAGQSKPQIQFAENANLSTVIAAIIRDSEYLKKILKDIDKNIDQFGYIDYFLIRAESVQKTEFDPVSKKHYEKFTFIVSPFKIHYSKIPGFQSKTVPEEKMKVLSLREYNYIYTGKNIDVLGFKLNFNNLFFEAVPVNNGNTNQPNARQGLTREGSSVVRNSGEGGAKQEISNKEIPVPQGRVDTSASEVVPGGATGNQRQDDVYSALAKNMHAAIVNSKGSMLSGDLEILGDPYYLVTGGIGNYNPKPALGGPQSTIDGEANQTYGEVLVTINFRNPVDINSLEDGGLYEFDYKRVPFSGVYSVQSITSTFQDGFFKQKLSVLRAPGQVLAEYDKSSNKSSNTNKTEVLANQFKITPKALDTPMADTTVGSPAGSRPDTINLLTQLGRGLPSPGLPGMLSNFTSAVGGLGGSVSGLLNQVSGAVTSGIGKLSSAASVFGGAIPGGVDQLASGIRLNASGITNLAQTVLGSAALVNQVSNSLQTSFPVTNAASSLATDIVSKASSIVNSISAPGSGIGVGASVLINQEASAAASTVASLDATTVPDAATLNLAKTTSVGTSIKSLTGAATGLGNNSIAAVYSLGASGASLVNGVGDKLKSITQGLPTDPTALASKFGFNPSQIAGLSDNLQSKVMTQLSTISKNLPEDTNLSQAVAQGVVLDYVPTGKIANLPATSPYQVAPSPEANQGDLKSIAEKGGPAALARAFGVKDVSKISSEFLPADLKTNILSSVDTNLNNPLANLKTQFNLTDATALGGKLLSAKSQLSGITGGVGQSLESKLNSVQSLVGSTINSGNNLSLSVTSKLGSLAASSSPLDKLINSGGDVS